MREFLSKSIAGGLSASVVLLWWPVLFEEGDSVTSWLVRGAAWTVCFELLLIALVPFERALWETSPGERISSKVGAAGSRLNAGSHRRRLGQLSLMATAAIAVPLVLLVAGLHEHTPASAEAKVVRPVEVVKVTKVVKVKRVVERAPTSGQPITTTPTPPEVDTARPAPTRPALEPPGDQDARRKAPVQRESAPAKEPEPEEPVPTAAPSF